MSTRWSRIFLGVFAGASFARAWVPEPWPLWPDGNVSVAFEFAVTAPNQTTPWSSAANDAIAMWNTHAQRVQITPVAASGKPQYDNGRNELFFSDRIYDEAFPTGVLAATLVTFEAEVRDYLAVHRKGGQACPRCGTRISEVSSRSEATSWCRGCQR